MWSRLLRVLLALAAASAVASRERPPAEPVCPRDGTFMIQASRAVTKPADSHEGANGTADAKFPCIALMDPRYIQADTHELNVGCNAANGTEPMLIPAAPQTWSRLLSTPPGHTDLPRTIWQFWEQGADNIGKPLNKVCHRQWAGLNPGWRQTVLDKDGTGRMFPELAELFERNPRTIQQRSDMLRLWLLAEHGGVWADMSLLPLMPLDKFIGQAVGPAGFWTFHFDPVYAGHVTSWFLAAKPKNPLVLRWRDAFVEKWKGFAGRLDYFVVHHTLMDLVKQGDPAVSNVWDRMPKVTEKFPHACIQKAMCSKYWDTTTPSQRAPMLKRPFQSGGGPPELWWEQYYEAMRDAKA